MTSRADGLVRHLSFAASVAFALTLAGTLGVVVWPRVSQAFGIGATPAAMPYVAGGLIDTPADWYQSSDYTLVVFARASCGACERAQPYLRQLVEFLGGRSAVVVAGGPESRDDDARLARSIGVSGPSIKTAPAGLRVRAIPTLLLVNRQGEILAAWEGVGPPEQQSAIARVLDEILK